MVDFKQNFDGRGVPQNLDAERSVLGALLLHPDAVVDVTFLKPDDLLSAKSCRAKEGWKRSAATSS
jgi:hypothetical protein